MSLVKFESVDNFKSVKSINPKDISEEVLQTVKKLDERKEIEPIILSILYDTNDTPHGPVEIVDILTHKVSINGTPGLAAFIIKGKSFPTVRPQHVSHQIYKLEKISDLKYTIFAATGTVLDQAKEQFISTSSRLGCDYLMLDLHDLSRLFVAFGFICPKDGKRIHSGKCSCGYSPNIKTPNVLQKDAISSLHDSHKMGHAAGLVVMPTGSGKTWVAVKDIASGDYKKVIYLAHTNEILDNAEDEFLKVFNSNDIFRADGPFHPSELKRINLTTIQLLSRHIRKFADADIDYVVVDEFHHAGAKSYRKTIETLRSEFLLGLTATPFRADRQDIYELCHSNILVSYELRSGIDSGVLCPYHYYGCFDDIDYSKIKHNGVHYDIRDLEKALIIPERDQAIISKWQDTCDGKATIAFCCSHKHAVRVAKSFKSNNISAKTYLSTNTREERKSLLKDFKSGKIKIICAVDVLNEGADLPFVEALLFLRPTESKRIFFQQLGRGLRRYVGKSHCVVIDFIGSFKNAYKIVEYQGLNPIDDLDNIVRAERAKSVKEVLNLPLGCEVVFDEKVIDVFADQTMNPAFATRYNIARILIYQYRKLERKLGRQAEKIDIDRSNRLDSSFYVLVFGSWKKFNDLIKNER